MTDHLGKERAHLSTLMPLAAIVYSAVSLYYLLLLHHCPAVYSWDVFLRVFHGDKLLVSHWLPLPQLFILVGRTLGLGIALAQAVSVASSSLAAAMLCVIVTAQTRQQETGFAAGLALGFLPSLTTISIMPYQEPLTLLFLFAAVYFLLSNPGDGVRVLLAAAAVLACLCRFEAWVVVTISAIWSLRRRDPKLTSALVPSLGVVIVLIALEMICSPPTDPAQSNFAIPSSFHQVVMLASRALVQEIAALEESLSWPVWATALIGMVACWKRLSNYRSQLLLVFMALVAMAFFRGFANGGFNPRMILFPSAMAIPFAVIGFRSLVERIPVPRAIKLTIFGAALVSVLAMWLGRATENTLEMALPHTPDASLARTLQCLPRSAVVAIVPMWSPAEHGIGSILANAPELDRLDSNVLAHYEVSVLPRPDHLVYWSQHGYVLCRLAENDSRTLYNRSAGMRSAVISLINGWRASHRESKCALVPL